MIFSRKIKSCVVWMVLICIFMMVFTPFFLHAESAAHKIVIGDNAYDLLNEPYENHMGLILNAKELAMAFGLEYAFDDVYKSFEIFCEDTNIMLMHEATHYYKGEEAIDCLPHFFVENGPMIELGLFCVIFDKEYTYNEDEKVIYIQSKANDDEVGKEESTTEPIEIEETLTSPKNELQEEVIEDFRAEETPTIDVIEKTEECVNSVMLASSGSGQAYGVDGGGISSGSSTTIVTGTVGNRNLSGELTLSSAAPESGLEVEFILQPVTNLISQTYGTAYYELEDAYSLGTVVFDSGESEKDYSFETTEFYNNSTYPRFCIYIKVIKNGKVETIRYISEYDNTTYQTFDILTFSRIAAYTPIRKFSFAHNEIADITIPSIDYSESTLSGTITLPEPAPRGGLEISLILQAVSTLKTTSYGLDYYSMGRYTYNIGTVSFEHGETAKDYEFEVDKYYDNLDYPNYIIGYETDLNNVVAKRGWYSVDGIYSTIRETFGGEIDESDPVKIFRFGRDNTANFDIPQVNNRCGENVFWSFDSGTQTLTVSGSGDMYNYANASDTPWIGSDVRKIVIDDGVTSLGNYAFSWLYTLQTVKFPNSLRHIGGKAFFGCKSLASVYMSNNVEIIGWSAFEVCDNLKTIYLPKSLCMIMNGAFDNCGLEEIYYAGSEEDWDNVSLGTSNGFLEGINICYMRDCESMFIVGQPSCVINGEIVALDSRAVSYKGKVFAPVRAVADSVGAEAIWNGEMQELTISKDGIDKAFMLNYGDCISVNGVIYVSIGAVWQTFLDDVYAIISDETSIRARTQTLSVDSVTAVVGKTFDVYVRIKNNPGIAGLGLKLNYPDEFVLESISQGAALDSLDFILPGNCFDTRPIKLTWDGLNADYTNGKILKCTFRVDENAPRGVYPIEITTIENSVYDDDLQNVEFNLENGYVTVLDYLPGDINGDGVVSTKDVTILRRYIVGGYDVTVVDEAVDVNDDGEVTTKDTTTLRRFIAGGYGIELK